mgnify:CR=1 FL=1
MINTACKIKVKTIGHNLGKSVIRFRYRRGADAFWQRLLIGEGYRPVSSASYPDNGEVASQMEGDVRTKSASQRLHGPFVLHRHFSGND